MNPGASFLNLGRRVRRGITAHVFESPKDLGDFPSMAWLFIHRSRFVDGFVFVAWTTG